MALLRVGAVDIGLDEEEILRVADVCAQFMRHLAYRFEHSGVNPLPRADHRILWVGYVKFGLAGIGVDYGFDGVADVV